MLNEKGEAGNFPKELGINDSCTFILGIKNHEFKAITYTVVGIEEDRCFYNYSFTITHGENKSLKIAYTPETPGKKRITFLLYKNGNLSQDLYIDLKVK